MALGDNRFSNAGTDLNVLLRLHGVLLPITRTIQGNFQSTDIYGTPQNYTPQSLQKKVLITGQELDETAVLSGGKPKEIIYFIACPGDIIENDEVLYNTHSYHVIGAVQNQISGSNMMETCKASREVDV